MSINKHAHRFLRKFWDLTECEYFRAVLTWYKLRPVLLSTDNNSMILMSCSKSRYFFRKHDFLNGRFSNLSDEIYSWRSLSYKSYVLCWSEWWWFTTVWEYFFRSNLIIEITQICCKKQFPVSHKFARLGHHCLLQQFLQARFVCFLHKQFEEIWNAILERFKRWCRKEQFY